MPRSRVLPSQSRRARPVAPPALAPTPPLPLAARWIAIVAAAAAILAVVSFPLADPDLWEHLRVGRAIWESHSLERHNVWSWPTYGAPYVIPSWLFRVALWPFYATGGVAGLFVWRWLTTLAAFAMLWAVARARAESRATGAAALLALAGWAMIYRFRSQCRPETLVAVLLALQLWLLETRRVCAELGKHDRFDRAWLLVPLTALWVNVHLSFPLALFVTFAYLLDAALRARRVPALAPAGLARVLAASAAACFVNPWGFGLVRPPFDFWVQRHDPILASVAELGPLSWGPYLSTGLPELLALTVAMALWRWRRRGLDLAELAILAAFIAEGLMTQRFIGYTAIVAAPFLARDLSEFCASRRWPVRVAAPVTRLVVAAGLVTALLVPAISQRFTRPSIALRESAFPIAACDAIEAQGVRGRSFNIFSHGGYLLWRFWPERDRLPFFDIHQTGTPEDRAAYLPAMFDSSAWAAFDRRHRFDWVLLGRQAMSRTRLLDMLDADTTHWSLTFVDDVAALYVRRDGASAAAAERYRYRWMPGGDAKMLRLSGIIDQDSTARIGLFAELARSTRESRWSASSHFVLGNVAMAMGRTAEARARFDSAFVIDPGLPGLAARREAARSAPSGTGR
jgi:hypothetical protein